MIYQIETEDGVLRVIRHRAICDNAEFQLDKPHIIRPGEKFELKDGAWFTFEGEHRVTLEGRWKVLNGNG